MPVSMTDYNLSYELLDRYMKSVGIPTVGQLLVGQIPNKLGYVGTIGC